MSNNSKSAIETFVEGNKAIFEECLLAKDPLVHLKSLSESPEKQLLLFLLQPHSEDYSEQLKTKYSIEHGLIEEINRWKVQLKVASAQHADEIQYLMQQIFGYDDEAFYSPKPAEFQTATNNVKLEESELSSRLKPIPPLK
jgi:hypothetical protein